jgi:hypothetical protein
MNTTSTGVESLFRGRRPGEHIIAMQLRSRLRHHPRRCSESSTHSASPLSPCGCARSPSRTTSPPCPPRRGARSPATATAPTSARRRSTRRRRSPHIPGTARQLVVTGLGREAPTVIVTKRPRLERQTRDRALRPADGDRTASRQVDPIIPPRRPRRPRAAQRRPRHRAVGARRGGVRLAAPPTRRLSPRHS